MLVQTPSAKNLSWSGRIRKIEQDLASIDYSISPSLSNALDILRSLAAFFVVLNHIGESLFVFEDHLDPFNLFMFQLLYLGHHAVMILFVVSGFLIGAGSGYYHYSPDNQTLFWDRLPMTLGFMGVFAAVISERVSARAGWWLLGPFLVWGVVSVEVWRRTELAGAGDLRMYALVQFYPMLAIPLILWLFPPRYTASHRVWQMILWYMAAKILEAADVPIHRLLGLQMSGHALKHLAAAMALWMPLRMLSERTPTSSR